MVKQYGQLLRETRARLRPTEGELAAQTARELLGRYLFAAVSAALVFFCTPFELVVRQTLCIVCFAPLSSLAPIYTDRCHGAGQLHQFGLHRGEFGHHAGAGAGVCAVSEKTP